MLRFVFVCFRFGRFHWATRITATNLGNSFHAPCMDYFGYSIIGFQMTVDSNHAIALILVLLRFFIGFIKWSRNHSTNQKQSKYWYWLNWPIKSMSKTLIGIAFASHQVSHQLPRVALHFIPLSSVNTNSMLFLYFFSFNNSFSNPLEFWFTFLTETETPKISQPLFCLTVIDVHDRSLFPAPKKPRDALIEAPTASPTYFSLKNQTF